MAPALTSDAFRVATIPHSKPEPRATRPTVNVYARQNLFGIGGKPPSGGESQEETKKPNFPKIFTNIEKLGAKALVPVASSPSTSLFAPWRRKDPNTVFVAGATGPAGARIAQMLLRQGFAVRAGVPELASAQELALFAAAYKIISPEESKRLNAVKSTFGDEESLAKAIGPATKVVVTIAAGEKGPTAPGVVTTDDALRVVRAAQLSGVSHLAVVYDAAGPGGPASSTYNVLDGITSFFNSLFAKSQPLTLPEFLSKVVETDVSYTLIKAALTEDYAAESSYGIVVAEERRAGSSTVGDGKVSKSQIAKLVADVFSNTAIAENKVVEVCTSPSATSKPIKELFSAIPEDGRRKAYAEALAKAKAEEKAMAASIEAEASAKKLEEAVQKPSKQESQAASLAKEAQERAAAASATVEGILNKAKNFGGGDFSWGKLSLQLSSAASQKLDEEPGAQLATIRGQAKAQNLPPKKAVFKRPAPKLKPKQLESKPKAKQPEPKVEVRNVFGGLFKQETIYVDDD